MSSRRVDDTDPETAVDRPEAVLMLWGGVLLAPGAFLTAMVINYALTAPICGHRHDLVIHGVHAVSMLIGLLGLALSWSSHRITRGSTGAGALGPGVRFLSRVALGTNFLFLLVMLVQWAPSFVYIPC
jgi:hypothetical protein